MPESVGSLLNAALAQYRAKDPNDLYDEVLRTVSERAARQQYLTKADIGSLVLWKRITAQASWATALGMTPDDEVREATGRAWKLLDQPTVPSPEAAQDAREALRDLPGLGGPAMASAVLLALAPERMAIWDQRVEASLTALDGRIPPRKEFFRGYLTRFLELAGQMEEAGAAVPVIPRHVDLALWEIARSSDLLTHVKRITSHG